MPIGPDEVYTMFKLAGRDAGAAAYTLRKDQQSHGVRHTGQFMLQWIVRPNAIRGWTARSAGPT
jgi:hypothetical protein